MKKEQLQTYPDEMLVRAAKKYFKGKVKDILDAGSGEGKDAIMFRKEGYNVTALDNSPSILRWLTYLDNSIPTHLASIVELPFEKDSFDAVLCWRVLYYLSEAEQLKAIKEFRRVLRKGGFLYISIPSPRYNFGKVNTYTENDFKKLLKGFRLTYGTQEQSFLGEPHKRQAFWHILGILEEKDV